MNINFKDRITEKEYINLNLMLLYQKTQVKFITGGMLFCLLGLTIQPFIAPEFSQSPALFIGPVVFILLLPVSTYYAAKKGYPKHRISEMIEYTFTDRTFALKGDSFSSELTWEKVYKVTATKNWVLIWHNKIVANPIPRRHFMGAELSVLKEILNNNNVKNSL